jgi:DNA-binding CsgD family transcriptional regulator
MQTQHAVFAPIIHAIGEREFPAVIAESVRECIDFDLVALISHGRNDTPTLLFDNFDTMGGRGGVENYIHVTHAVNPILCRAMCRTGVFRARDFPVRAPAVNANLRPYMVKSADEELGFRTLGWPERLEEIGLYFESAGRLIELSLYRQRVHRMGDYNTLRHLEALHPPLVAAFNKHASLLCRTPARISSLTPRETEVTRLLLRGRDSDEIARSLGISRHTVKDHRKRIFRKLEVNSLAQLFAACSGLGRSF